MDELKLEQSLTEETDAQLNIITQPEETAQPSEAWSLPSPVVILSFFLIEVFGFLFLTKVGNQVLFEAIFEGADLSGVSLWPLAFGGLWAVILGGILRLIPRKVSRILFGIVYFLSLIYAGVQTGYFWLFGEMMWLSDFRYASEGSDYFSILLKYPAVWWVSILVLIVLGVLILWKYPRRHYRVLSPIISILSIIIAIIATCVLPYATFQNDRNILYAGSDYGRAQSARAAYENMFNTHRLYQLCGLHQTVAKDIYKNYIFPLTPAHAQAQAQARQEIDSYFDARGEASANDMTGIFEGKNVVFVLMESMDDWAIGEHTPTICRLMDEGINFTNFYTPAYGGVRTFNSEFCGNTGSFLSSQGGYAFDFVTNDYRQSLANLLNARGYSSKVYHYNSPDFYSRGVFSPAMGYDEYVCYEDYVTEENKQDLYDDQFLFDNETICSDFFREGQNLNFIITRSAHLSYVYNEVLSYWGLQKYPYYRGLTFDEEEDCMYLKARLVDDMFTRLLQELEEHGQLENTVIVAYTDHYTYGVQDDQLVLDRSGVDDMLLVEKTPFFIWSPDCPDLDVTKTLNTADLLPTVLNLMGIDSPYRYLGQDAFDESYMGYALFPNGSWVSQGIAYNAATNRLMLLGAEGVPEGFLESMSQTVTEFVRINNLILETDYYRQ